DGGGIEDGACGVDRRLGRIQVFRRLVTEGAAAESDHASLEIADGKHEAAAETVVDPAPALTSNREACPLERIDRDVLTTHEREQAVPAFRREAEAESPRHVDVDSALAEISTRRVATRPPERVGEEARG